MTLAHTGTGRTNRNNAETTSQSIDDFDFRLFNFCIHFIFNEQEMSHSDAKSFFSKGPAKNRPVTINDRQL